VAGDSKTKQGNSNGANQKYVTRFGFWAEWLGMRHVLCSLFVSDCTTESNISALAAPNKLKHTFAFTVAIAPEIHHRQRDKCLLYPALLTIIVYDRCRLTLSGSGMTASPISEVNFPGRLSDLRSLKRGRGAAKPHILAILL